MIPGLCGALLGSLLGIPLAIKAEQRGFAPRVCDCIMYTCVIFGVVVELL